MAQRSNDAWQGWLDRLPLAAGQPLKGYGCTTLIVAVSALLRALADHWLPIGYPYLGFFPAIILSCFLFGQGPGIYAAIVCGLIAWFRFIPPADTMKFGPEVLISLVFYGVVVGIDIALIVWMQRANRRLREQREFNHRLAENRETLFSELQHRISNNIQMVGALLTLQKRNIADREAREALDEAARRLGTIGRLHRQLHDPDGALLGLGPFLDRICRDVLDGAGHPGLRHAVEVDASIILNANQSIPVALIVAEAVSNAIEHGYPADATGLIRIRLDERAGEARRTLLISDDGTGLPDSFSLQRQAGMGLGIAMTLARQIGGSFEVGQGPSGGTEARLVLPA